MFHPHPMLGKTVYVELEDIHTERGIFIDSELGVATTLLVGRCRVCGYVYMPVALAPSDCTPPPTVTANKSSQRLY
jgi:hypothetical protein